MPQQLVEQFRQRHAAPRDGPFHQPRGGAVRLCTHEVIGDGGKGGIRLFPRGERWRWRRRQRGGRGRWGIRGYPSRRRDATRAPARRYAPACPARHESLVPARRKARRRRGRVRPAPAALHATARAGRHGRPGEVCAPARFSIRRASPATPFLPLPFWMRSRCSIAIQSA